MHFIQETGFSFELDQIAGESAIDELTQRVEVVCQRAVEDASICHGYGCLEWGGELYVFWYCINGETVTLRSIVSARP